MYGIKQYTSLINYTTAKIKNDTNDNWNTTNNADSFQLIFPLSRPEVEVNFFLACHPMRP